MFTLAVLLAVVAAFLIACGAELQEHAAVRFGRADRRPIAFFLRLLRAPRWVLGALLAGAGVGVHVVALTKGPVAAIQPVGTVGLLFAVGIKAVMDRTRVERLAIGGCGAVIVGLAVLLILLPHGSGRTTVPLVEAVLAGALALAVTGAALMLPANGVRPEVKAGSVALGAGMCFGIAAAVVGVVGRRFERDAASVLSWPTLLVVVLLVSGGVAQQQAYRMARFALVYAVLLAADPLTAGFAGVLLLGEPMPTRPGELAGLALAALVMVTGVVALAHAREANRTVVPEGQACAS